MTSSTLPPAPRATGPLGIPPLSRRLLFWVALAAIAAGLVSQPLVNPDLFGANDAFWIAAVLSLGQTGVVALLAWLLARRRSVGPSLMALGFGWGAAVAVAIATRANTDWGSALDGAGLASVSAALTAPAIEETSKLAGALIVLALIRPRPIGALHGAVVGFVVGAGFDVVENFGYAIQSSFDADSSAAGIAAALDSLAVRMSWGTLLHALWTGIAAAALAGVLGSAPGPARRRAVLGAAGGFAAAVGLHAGWDLPALSSRDVDTVVSQAVLYAASLGLFLLAWGLGLRAESRRPPSGPSR